MNSQYQVKTMLKEKAALLQKHDSELFGKKFRNHIADTIKSKRETREIFTESRKPFLWSPSYPPRRSEGQKVFLTNGGGSNYGKFNNGSSKFRETQTSQQRYGKYTFFKQNLLQHEFSSRNKVKMGIRKCSPIDKKVVLKGLEKLTRDQSILDLVHGYIIPFQRKSFQSKTPFQLAASREQQKLLD